MQSSITAPTESTLESAKPHESAYDVSPRLPRLTVTKPAVTIAYQVLSSKEGGARLDSRNHAFVRFPSSKDTILHDSGPENKQLESVIQLRAVAEMQITESKLTCLKSDFKKSFHLLGLTARSDTENLIDKFVQAIVKYPQLDNKFCINFLADLQEEAKKAVARKIITCHNFSVTIKYLNSMNADYTATAGFILSLMDKGSEFEQSVIKLLEFFIQDHIAALGREKKDLILRETNDVCSWLLSQLQARELAPLLAKLDLEVQRLQQQGHIFAVPNPDPQGEMKFIEVRVWQAGQEALTCIQLVKEALSCASPILASLYRTTYQTTQSYCGENTAITQLASFIFLKSICPRLSAGNQSKYIACIVQSLVNWDYDLADEMMNLKLTNPLFNERQKGNSLNDFLRENHTAIRSLVIELLTHIL